MDGNGTLDGGWARTRVLLAHPHELLLGALSRMLEGAGFAVVARCHAAGALSGSLRAHAPDIALVDVDLAPGDDLRRLLDDGWRGLHGGRLVLLAAAVEPELAHETLDLEVDGVLLKSASCDDVLAGLRRVAAGDAIFPAGWLQAAHRAAREPADEVLSARQREVLRLLAQGLPNDVIAQRLRISRNTVKFHVAAIYDRLGVRNRVQAATALASLGADGGRFPATSAGAPLPLPASPDERRRRLPK